MSVINKMLQDLDRRNAIGGPELQGTPQAVKPVDANRGSHEWFWRMVAALLLGALAWVGWVAYQLQPRTLATEQAFSAAEQARRGPAPPVEKTVAVVPPAPAPLPVAEVAEPKPIEAAETFKLARTIETPITERPAAAKPPQPRKAAPTPPKTTSVKGTVDKRERTRAPLEVAEAQFRRAALLLNQGRVSEAEDHLVRALKADGSHAAARQAYVALLLEQQRVDEALQALRETLAANPAQPVFALALARIHVEQRDYGAALHVLESAGPAAHAAEVQAMRGVVLQRQGRHAEAADAYRAALQGGAQSPASWMGLGISLEALGHRAEAAEAYRRALGAGPLAGEAREYAEARIRALQ